MLLKLHAFQRQLFVACLILSSRVAAQDVVYFANGDPLPNTRITDVTEQKVVLTALLDGGPRVRPFSRPNILLAFTKAGNYLLVSELATDAVQAKQQLNAFLTAPPRTDGYDYLIKAVPLTVIPAHISYESTDVVNYKMAGGNAASISKGELLAILYKDGRHLLTVPAADAASLLADARTMLANGGQSAAVTIPATPTVAAAVPTQSPAVSSPPETAALPDMAPRQLASVATMPAATTLTDERSKPTLSDEEKEAYRQKSLLRVEEFVQYINLITDQTISSDAKDRAISQAVKLFIPQSTIQVTSAKRPGSRTMSVEQYLMRLKLLPYLSTQIEWAQTQFVRDLTQAPDGNYYGTIAAQQTFIGKGADGKPEYSDVTPKNVRVRLDAYQKVIDGQEVDKWRILLGNVSVGVDSN